MDKASLPIALLHCERYGENELDRLMGGCLDAVKPFLPASAKIMVKPNLLQAHKLACTNPLVVGSVCRWLLDNGHRPFVSDSPGFGTAKKVAAFIGLDEVLKKLAVPLMEMDRPARINISLSQGKTGMLSISARALECDAIFSVPRIKAHGMMLVTLAVKNCFGCVKGVRKAFLHASKGGSHELFADYLAGLWEALPPVIGVCDGITAMSKTGPAKGEACNLGLIGACASAPLLDLAILKILKVNPQNAPLAQNLLKRYPALNLHNAIFPLEKPEDFNAEGFQIPDELRSCSFSPARLFKSVLKRIWKMFRA